MWGVSWIMFLRHVMTCFMGRLVGETKDVHSGGKKRRRRTQYQERCTKAMCRNCTEEKKCWSIFMGNEESDFKSNERDG